MEKAAYHLMIETYYIHELPLPGDYSSIYRLLPAITQSEREAVRRVLTEFFTLESDGRWHQKRCDEEIARQQKASEIQRTNVEQRWKGKQSPNLLITPSPAHTNSVAKTTKEAILESVSLGIGVSKAEDSRALGSTTKGYDGNTAVIPPGIPPMKHETINTFKAAAARVPGGSAHAHAQAAAAAGLEIAPNDPRLAALVADGATPGECRIAAAKAIVAGKGPAYFFATVSGMRRDAGSVGTGKAQEGTKTGSESPYRMLPRANDPWT
jgi:uncharacterized protein YdaU (DUF1376 family)